MASLVFVYGFGRGVCCATVLDSVIRFGFIDTTIGFAYLLGFLRMKMR